MKTSKELWISRDCRKSYHEWLVVGWRNKPELDEYREWQGVKEQDSLLNIDVSEFASYFGFVPRAGSCKKYRFMVEEI